MAVLLCRHASALSDLSDRLRGDSLRVRVADAIDHFSDALGAFLERDRLVAGDDVRHPGREIVRPLGVPDGIERRITDSFEHCVPVAKEPSALAFAGAVFCLGELSTFSELRP